MVTFQDKWSRWHDKPCVDEKPSSNNGWIYTAYAQKLGLSYCTLDLLECSVASENDVWPKWDRTPGKMFPPLSRDEVLGMFICGVVYIKEIERAYWQFCNLPGFKPKSLWKVSWWKAARAAWKIRNAHRNALWEEEELWHFGFRLPPQDTWFILKSSGRNTSLLHTLYFYISSWLTVFGKSSSGKLILWVKLVELGMEDSALFKFLEVENAFNDYFMEGHPFRKAINEQN